MELSHDQLTVVEHVHLILAGAGLSPQDLGSSESGSERSPSPPNSCRSSRASPVSDLFLDPSPVVLASPYIPPPARPFTPEELTKRHNKVNRRQFVDAIVEHPPGAVVEYPQSGATAGQAVAHIFTIDPTDFDNPKSSFQYSMGNNHGSRPRVKCGLLRDHAGEPVTCDRLKSSCRGLKVCSARSKDAPSASHSYTSCVGVQHLIAPQSSSYVDTAKAEVFMKTLALFCALSEHGCSFAAHSESTGPISDETVVSGYLDLDIDADGMSDSDVDSDTDVELAGSHTVPVLYRQLRSSWQRKSQTKQPCHGNLIMRRDKFN
ncbi:hypothetical protein PAXINDRAFT_182194 [Paxillus involutus ATCC 200175]|uniref:Uncharacterized protein n=1 Tax=Paxillus involutus ATCC 200175 TaxID=664439 RepID=A0A0C9T032_PAXIN|nr:hypothetical protein PAXINDRAFT_182194 [Paxillus involutus ATCC 200175]